MKLHLPLSLYKSLLLLMSACAVTDVQAGLMHQDVDIQVYADFGQNKGRYVTSAHANELVQFIRTQEGGIAIPYTDGSAPFYITNEQGMINFAGTGDNGAYAAIAPNAMVTVRHNGSNDASYGEREVGSEHAINYSAIDIKINEESSVFRLVPIQDNGNLYDYMIQRQSKIVTDAVYNPLTGVDDVSAFEGQYLYHSGAGLMGVYKEGTGYSSLAGAYAYTIGGINTITDVQNGSGNNSVISSPGYGDGRGACQENPLPNGLQGGDSGSPVYIYNASTGSYEYVAAQQSGHQQGGNGWSQARGNVKWTRDTLESFNARVTMSPTTSTVYLNAIDTAGETKTEGTNSATLYSGAVKDSTDNELVRYNGVQSGLNTWGDLSTVKDLQNWYAYDSNAYLQRSDAELFFSNNLVFSSNAAENTIVLNDTVDLGIGYAEFNGGKFTITSEDRESNQFNHAGYVINKGAEVHLKLVNPDDYMTEWRKTGAGALYIDGNGNTNALLNVGGSGTTYLQQTGGYAAYNVLASSGATVEIADTDQIKRDFTFGAGGGVLNMNGKSMEWNNSNGTDADGFTIHALDEQAVVANLSRGTTTVLTWTQGDSQTFLGSFRDNGKDSCLQFVYDGGAEGRLTMHSIKTKLTAPGSGITVNSGTLVLAGSHTVHGKGSATGRNGERLLRENDWHYADATAPVTVNGGTFELGSHARLIGDVTVAENATYVMREGVAHALEYVEGGIALEETSKYADYFGHKGHVILNGGKLAVQFNDGVDTNTTYGYNVSGAGDITVDAGNDGGSFTFSGAITATGKKTVTGGTLLLSGAAAVDNGSGKWLVESGGQMSLDNVDMIDVASTGTLVLSRDTESYLDRSNHSQMLLGAQVGKEVQYGAVGTQETLRDWNLGGAGTLVVNYVVSGSETLTVDGRGGNSGVVRLQQIADDYSGTINVQSEGGRMVLDVGNVELETTVNVKNGGVLRATDAVVSGESNTVELYGNLEYDSFTVRDGATLNLRVSGQGRLDADNAVTISGGGVMRLWQQTLADKVNLENGGIMYGKGGTIGETASVMATEGKGILNAGGGTFAIDKGTIGAEAGATLRLENGTFNIYSKDINSAGGTLELACSTINLGYRQNEVTQTIGGTLKVANDLTIYTRQGTPAQFQGMTFDINHLHIDASRLLTLETGSGEFRHRYNIASLTGSGTIHWKNNMSYFYKGPSLMILTGDNDFSGTLIVEQKCGGGSLQHVGLSHENAAKGMAIDLRGDSDNRPGLAVSAKTAQVAGIDGTVNTFVYAGAIKTDWNGDNPTSSALNTLIINTGTADHTYNGTLLGDSSYGLDIVKDGSGTQTFTSGDNVVHDVTALQGHLNFTNAPTIYGDVSIAQGAQLTVGGDNLELADGRILHVLAGAAGQSASLTNTLTITGGEMRFGAFDHDAPSLNLGGVQAGAGFSRLDISFTNRNSIEMGTTYTLASGDWSAFAGKLNQRESRYLNAVLNAGTSGLTASFSLKDGYVYWTGDESVLTPGAKVVFSGKENVYTAGISTSAVVDTGVFDNSGDFTIGSANGSSLTFTTLEKYGSGALVVDTGVSADTAYMMENASLKGSGELSVTTLQLASGTRTEVQGLKLSVSNAIGGEGMLSMGAGSTLQVDDTTTGSASLLDGSALTSSGSTVALGLTLGEAGKASRVKLGVGSGGLSLTGALSVQGDTTIKVTSGNNTISASTCLSNGNNLIYDVAQGATLNVSGQVHADETASKGCITKSGAGTLILSNGTNSYADTTTVNGGILQVSTAGALGSSALVINDGAEARIGASRTLKGDTTVNAGGRLTFTSTDTIEYGNAGVYSRNLTVDGGTLDFGGTRQTMAKWNLTLKNGATVAGTGGAYDGSAYTAALDFSQDSTIKAEGVGNIISANVRLRYGNSRTLTYQVAEGADLEVSGRMHADTTGALGKVTKSGSGKLVLSSQTRLNLLNTEAGEVVLAYNGADGNILEGLDGAMTGGNTALGVLRLAEKVKLTVTNIWSRAVTGIYLENGAEMTLSGQDLVVTGTGMGTARFGVIESDGKKYAKDSIDYELRNGHMKSTADADTSVANRLTYASVENAGSATLTVSNSANTLTGVSASGGDVILHHMGEAMSLDLLEIAAGKTVNAYVGTNAETPTTTTTVTGSALLSGTATLNTSLTLADGATLEMTGLEAGAVNLSGALTFGTGLKMGESLLASVGALGYGETLNLFTGLSGVNLPVAVDTESSRVLASSVFSNVQSNTLYVGYRVIDNVGSLLVVNVPEPTTATLSLLALAGLAARRRRK